MTVGEDKNKIRNILIPAVPKFRQLYSPFIDQYLTLSSDESYTVNVSMYIIIVSACTIMHYNFTNTLLLLNSNGGSPQ